MALLEDELSAEQLDTVRKFNQIRKQEIKDNQPKYSKRQMLDFGLFVKSNFKFYINNSLFEEWSKTQPNTSIIETLA